jgi:hypothetical protein
MNEGRDKVRAVQLGAIDAERCRDDQAVFRGPMGGLNPWRSAAAGPHRAFAIKISKLNPKSPRGGEGLRSLPSCRPGPPGQRRKFLREIPKTFFWATGRGSDGGFSRGATEMPAASWGLKCLRGRAHRPHRSSCADFFSAPRLLIGQSEIRRNQTTGSWRASPCVCVTIGAALSGAARGAAENCGFIFSGHLEQRTAILRIAAKFGVGGVARMRRG